MEDVNAAAAARPRIGRDISTDRLVQSFGGQGRGVVQLNSEAEQNPGPLPQIAFGNNMTEAMAKGLESVGLDVGKIRLSQMAFASSGTAAVPSRAAVACSFSVATPDASAGYDLTELRAEEFDLAWGEPDQR